MFLPMPSESGNKNDVLFFYILGNVLASAIDQQGLVKAQLNHSIRHLVAATTNTNKAHIYG